jgi:3-oxoacyl-[acyl-carrier protein] reductase
MRRRGGGSIINMSSSTVLAGRPNYLHYVTAKAGVVGLTRALARELGSHDVTVNALMPGSVDTGIPRDSAQPGAVDQIVASQALRRRLRPTDIAGAAVFLASDAARAITGQSVVVDGGMNFL